MGQVEMNRREKGHLEAMRARLEYVSERAGESRKDEPDYVPGEGQAIAWAIGLLESKTEMAEIRLHRLEEWRRKVESRFGRIEAEIYADE